MLNGNVRERKIRITGNIDLDTRVRIRTLYFHVLLILYMFWMDKWVY
jgi:hypothetical protein